MAVSSKMMNVMFGMPILGNLIETAKSLSRDIQGNKDAYGHMSEYDKERYDANPYWRGEEGAQYANDVWQGMTGSAQSGMNMMMMNQMINGQRFTHGSGAAAAPVGGGGSVGSVGGSGGMVMSPANQGEGGRLLGGQALPAGALEDGALEGALEDGALEGELGELLPLLMF
jgi:hypothetical protein